jgi:hypothetical protein
MVEEALGIRSPEYDRRFANKLYVRLVAFVRRRASLDLSARFLKLR